jgi:hypothetical protein
MSRNDPRPRGPLSGLSMRQAADEWPCSVRTFRKIIDARDGDGNPILRTYPLAPNSEHRRTTMADLQAAREQLAAMEEASLDAAIAKASKPKRRETVAEAIERMEREGR